MLGLLLNIVHVHAMYTAINSPPPGLERRLESDTKMSPSPGFENQFNAPPAFENQLNALHEFENHLNEPPGFLNQFNAPPGLNANSKQLPPPGFENEWDSDLRNNEAYCRSNNLGMCYRNHVAEIQSSKSAPYVSQWKSTRSGLRFEGTEDMLTPVNEEVSQSGSSWRNARPHEGFETMSNPVNLRSSSRDYASEKTVNLFGVNEFVAEPQANTPIYHTGEFATHSARLFNPHFYIELQTSQFKEITRNLLQGQHTIGYPFVIGPPSLNQKNYNYKFEQPMLNGESSLTVVVDVLGLLVACQKDYAPIPLGTNFLLFEQFYENDVFCKIRPGAFEFLEHVKSKFRLVIMTSSFHHEISGIVDHISYLWDKYAKTQGWQLADRSLPSRAYGDLIQLIDRSKGKNLTILRRKSYKRVVVVDNQGIFKNLNLSR